MASASAQLLVSVNGGAPASGGHTTTDDSATIALSAVSKVGWGNPPTKWQIASFPSGFACPAGWSTVTTTIAEQAVTVYQYVGNGDPPAFDLPGGGWWGKLLFRLVVLGGATSTLVDELCGVEVRSPNGVRDIAFLEAGQFDAARRAAGPLQANLRKLEDALAAGGGGGTVTAVTGTAPIVSSGGATPAISISAASGTGPGSMSVAHWTLCNAATDAATASTLAKRDAAGRMKAVAGVDPADVAVVSQLGSGGGWTKLASFDFTTLPAQTLGSDGAVTIDGIACAKVNSANESAAMAIVAGVGLVNQPGSSTDFNGTANTAPALDFTLADLSAKFGPFTPVRVTIGIDAATTDNAQFRGTFAAILGATRREITKRVYTNDGGPSDVYLETTAYENGSASGQKAVTTHRALRIELPFGLLGCTVLWSSAPYTSGALPDEADFVVYRVIANSGGGLWGPLSDLGSWQDWIVKIGAHGAGSSGFTSVISAADIEARL